MGGVDVGGGGKGGRKSLDSEINMIPFIDLLMVTISFLLITAVWSNMARINANAQVPGPPHEAPVEDTPKEKQLHVEMTDKEKFVLIWKEGGTVVSTVDVQRKDDVVKKGEAMLVKYPDLAAAIEREWKSVGAHRDASDKNFDTAILHTDNETAYVYLIGVIDAIYTPHRPFNVGGKTEEVPAFNVTFSVN